MKVLNDEEQAAMDAIGAAHRAIHDFGLSANAGELTAAIHVLQGFVVQRALHRLDPENFSDWYASASPSEPPGLDAPE